ncbi:unnamed protein product [Rotaria sordida]|uniref:Major facilitator superfamily (MFS) profile domain-containing protein n=1 Tax=Rotaria sordida TaxID=392033 RepID=A0A815JUE5_9BILA|nr:unnamed protein product [Rotaria sordida]
MGIENDLKLSPSERNWDISLFFLAYLIFAIPSSILMRYIGATRYLSLSMLAWGSITVGLAFVRNAQQLLSVKFLLGMTQAGFFTSIVIYFSLWYRKRDQTMRIAILYGATIISGALSGILAYGFTYLDSTRGLNSWQWMFLLEGLPMIPLGIITCLFLSNIPDTVQWLNNSEKQLLTNLLRHDAGIANGENVRLSWRQAFYVFVDWRIYLYALINIGIAGVFKYINTYLPLLVEDMGYLKGEVHLMTVPPYVFAFVCCLLVNYSSSRRNEHGFHLIFCLSITLVGFILMLTLIDRGQVALYVSICITCCGILSAFPLLISWLTNNVGGYTKRSIAIGFIVGIGQIGGIILPFVYYDKSTNRRNIFIYFGTVVASLVLVIILRICLMLENRWRDNLSREKYDRLATIDEPCDWHPQVRYVL